MIKIFGIGNILLGDDGFGSTFVTRYKAQLEALAPQQIEVRDIGAHTIEAVSYLDDCEYLFIVDALKVKDGEKNQIYILNKDDMIDQPKSKIVMSSHSDGVQEILNTAEWTGVLPKYIKLYGAITESFDHGIALSPHLEEKMEPIKDMIVQEIKQILAL